LPQIAVNTTNKGCARIYVYFCEMFLRCCLYVTMIALRLLYVEDEGLE